MLLVNHLVFSKDLEEREVFSNQAFWSYFRSYCLSYASGTIVFAERIIVNSRLESGVSIDKYLNGNSSLLGSISLLPMMNRAVSLDAFIRSSAMMKECPIWLKPEMSLVDKRGDICMHCKPIFNCVVKMLWKDKLARQALIQWIDPLDFELLISVLYPDISAFVTVSRLRKDDTKNEARLQWDNYLKVASEHYLTSCGVKNIPIPCLREFEFREK